MMPPAGHVGEPGKRCRIVDAIICAVDGSERLAEFMQRRLAASPDLALGHHHPHGPVVQPTEAVNADGVAVEHTPLWRPRYFDLGDQIADGWIRTGKLYAGRLAH